MEDSEPATSVVRLSRIECAGTDQHAGKGQHSASKHWTIYGVDALGDERVYVEHGSEAEHEEWRVVDPLWQAAQAAIFRRLLADPVTRDLVLQINNKSAIEQDNLETAKRLFDGLSDAAKARLLTPRGDE